MTAEEADAVLCSLDAALDGGVTLAWAVEHGDRLAEAWSLTREDRAMRQILVAAQHPAAGPPGAPGYPNTLFCARWRSCWRQASACSDCADAIRAQVPALTLAQVLEGARRG